MSAAAAPVLSSDERGTSGGGVGAAWSGVGRAMRCRALCMRVELFSAPPPLGRPTPLRDEEEEDEAFVPIPELEEGPASARSGASTRLVCMCIIGKGTSLMFTEGSYEGGAGGVVRGRTDALGAARVANAAGLRSGSSCCCCVADGETSNELAHVVAAAADGDRV